MTNEELLLNAGFIDKGDHFAMEFGGGFSVEAFVTNPNDDNDSNKGGVIFHLKKDNTLIQPSTQTVEPDDVAEAFKQLTSLLPLLVNIFNRKSSSPEKDFKLAIQLLQRII